MKFKWNLGFYNEPKQTRKQTLEVQYDMVRVYNESKVDTILIDKTNRLNKIIEKLDMPIKLEKVTKTIGDKSIETKDFVVDVSNSILLEENNWIKLTKEKNIDFFYCKEIVEKYNTKIDQKNKTKFIFDYMKKYDHDRQVIATMWLSLLTIGNFKINAAEYLKYRPGGYFKEFNFGVRRLSNSWVHNEDIYLSDWFYEKWGQIKTYEITLTTYGLEYLKDPLCRNNSWNDIFEIYNLVIEKYEIINFEKETKDYFN